MPETSSPLVLPMRLVLLPMRLLRPMRLLPPQLKRIPPALSQLPLWRPTDSSRRPYQTHTAWE